MEKWGRLIGSMENRRMYRYKRTIIIILAIGIILAFVVPFPVHKHYTATECEIGNYNYKKAVDIDIEGWYFLNLFSSDTFSGYVSIPDYDFISTYFHNR